MSTTAAPYVPLYGDYYPRELEGLLKKSREVYKNIPERLDYPEKTVPKGWPSSLPPSRMIWDPETFPTDSSHIIEITGPELLEISSALSLIKDLSIPHSEINKSTFSLPTLGPRLDAACQSVHFGLGICFVNGIPVEKYTAEENVCIMLGISSYFGETRGRQRDDGARLIHIFHALTRGFPANLSPIFNNHAQVFHNDMTTDILCMYCLSPASTSGGSNSYASLHKIYNYLAEHNPDVIHTLAAPDWPFDTYGYNPPFHTRPLLFYTPPEGEEGEEQEDEDEKGEDSGSEDGERTPRASILNLSPSSSTTDLPSSSSFSSSSPDPTPKIGRILGSLSPRQLSGSKVHPRPSGIPALTPRQQSALTLLESLCQKFSITHTLSRGSFVFLNNLSVLHNRGPYFDDPEIPVEKHRHLIRMFLRNEELAWTTPKELWLDWGRVFGEFDGVEERWVVDKEKDYRDQQRGMTNYTAGGEGGDDAY
ncbi:hypothetical protein TWF594_011417 [Orbilia oligospora]|uniref:TauD/TfdA-like domain-containing protein n=1 Tax=Orbilia oligospora TaxID=2813651 RepID=A0A7C8JVM7_ORBOL|nr:hypothetical protein TWF706_001476 [Orbilia oligospora]KAF3083064.1 hypothetical protein TWF706_001476 [Orbilia oligospora]KAF3142401.1 hypothetical protein TWF703_000789 [Orbilia oligospora]KAF3149375.1 hypothetical protein TWF594_011417 [Orbilia oligospora]